jgi:3'-phosphoadenosine 5'-phosphosulfate sulfotransferase (PAPS reductase)/FAD synthetase
MDRATGETGSVAAPSQAAADHALRDWAETRVATPDPNPFTPKWKDPDELTKREAKQQAELRAMRRSEIARRGLVEAQKEIKSLRDRGALFVISHSGGKDSQTMAIKIHQLVPDDQIVWVHAPLKGVEWAGGMQQIKRYKPPGVPLLLADAIDEEEEQKWLLEWVIMKGAWPSPGQRWCTSDFKRGPIRREVRRYADAHGYHIIVDAQGLRAQESQDRAARAAFEPLATEHGKKSRALGIEREWYAWSPIKWDSTEEIFQTIHEAGQTPMWTYVEGMTRSSCAFCIMASRGDLTRAAQLAPDLYAAYVAVEEHIGHTIHTRRGKRHEREAYALRHRLGKDWADDPSAVMRYPLEEVTGIQADPRSVRKYLRRIERTGKLRKPEVAGEKAYRRARRRPFDPERMRALRRPPELRQMLLGVPGRRMKNVDIYLKEAPTDPIDVPWAEEFMEDVQVALGSPRVALLVSPETRRLLERIATAPQRERLIERVRRADIEPMTDPSMVEEGWYRDIRTGRGVVVEEDGSWWRETPHPPGSFTLGELARLEALMWQDADRFVLHAHELDDKAREAALAWVEAADHLRLRMALRKVRPESAEEAAELKRKLLAIMLEGEQ